MRFPIRSCIACRKRENWNDLLRVVMMDDQVQPDVHHTLPGRGAWLHSKCFDTAVHRRAFNRAFKSSVDVKVDVLEEYIILLNKGSSK